MRRAVSAELAHSPNLSVASGILNAESQPDLKLLPPYVPKEDIPAVAYLAAFDARANLCLMVGMVAMEHCLSLPLRHPSWKNQIVKDHILPILKYHTVKRQEYLDRLC